MSEQEKTEKKTKKPKTEKVDKVEKADGKSVMPPGYIPRLHKEYTDRIVPDMMKKYGFTNRMQVPKIVSIVINMGLGEGSPDSKVLDSAV